MGEGAAPLARQQGHQRLCRPLEGSGLFEGVAPPIQVRLELIQHSHGSLWELSSESPRGVFVSGAERATRLNFENPPGLIGAGFGEGSETMDCDEVGFGWGTHETIDHYRRPDCGLWATDSGITFQ